MAQPIKYNTGNKTSHCCINRNNFDIGIVTDYAYGPTSSTDFYAGYDVPSGGFISFQNKGTQGPSIYEIPSINDVQYFGTQLNIGTTLTTDIAAVIRTANASNGLIMVNIEYPQIPLLDDNLVTFDAGYAPSYGWGGSAWYDIARTPTLTGGTQVNLTGATSFVTGSSLNNYSDSFINMLAGTQNAMGFASNFGAALQNFTVNIWVNINSGNGFLRNQNVIGQQIATAGYALQTNCNFLIRGNNTNGFEGVVRVAGVDYIADFGNPGNGWHNLTITYGNNQLKSFLDGGQVGSSAGPGVGVNLVNNGLQTIVGGTVNGVANTGNVQNYFDGGVGLYNIWSSTLTDPQVQNLYDLYKNRY